MRKTQFNSSAARALVALCSLTLAIGAIGAKVEADVEAHFGARTAEPLPSAIAYTRDLAPTAGVPRIDAPPVDLAAVQLEDEGRVAAGLPPRFAIPNPVRIGPASDGVWESLPGGKDVWRVRIGAPGAVSLNLGFGTYRMPVGGRLFVYSANGEHVVRPFTERDNAAHGELWTPAVASDEVVVEVTLPAGTRDRFALELTSVNVGYRGFGSDIETRSGSCNVDVVCPQGDPWRDEIPSVAVFSTGGSLFCTGAMLNNTAGNGTPYFLTANHCGINSGNAASLVVFWNYETSTCGGTPNGQLTDFQTGAFFRSSYGPSDFTLVELDEAPDPAWGVAFAGWDRSGANANQAIAIHHPSTDEKRISFENDPTTTTSYLSNGTPGDGTHVRVIDWDLGTTEPGSSGSPLFNQDHRVIGQLHGGFAACGNNTSDWYGKLSVSWTGGGNSGSRLSDWLDPLGSGALNVDTMTPEPPMPTGGCCTGSSCSILTEADCVAGAGSYLGDGADCSSAAGNPTVYAATPGLPIPDNGGAGNPAVHTIDVPDSFVLGDVDIDVATTHTYTGDLTVTVTHGGVTVTIVERPGHPASAFGCSLDNFDVTLDDEGNGGAMEAQCANNLLSPPAFTPNQPLSAFDGMDAAGPWTIRIWDAEAQDVGTLDGWALRLDGAGLSPCGAPTFDLSLNAGTFSAGQTMMLSADAEPGTSTDPLDVYVAVRLPNGSLRFLGSGGTLSTSAQPYLAGWTPASLSQVIFSYTFTGNEAGGAYEWLRGLAAPGTLDFVVPVSSTPFVIAP